VTARTRRKASAKVASTGRLAGRRLAAFERRLGPGWSVVRGRKLRATFAFADFASALDFVNEVGALAESQWHHPDLELAWGRVAVELSTHDVGGLSERDFLLAAKIDLLAKRRGRRRAKRGGARGPREARD
jgi:4a-hydroxytetrahydrobiopterin dehydratase